MERKPILLTGAFTTAAGFLLFPFVPRPSLLIGVGEGLRVAYLRALACSQLNEVMSFSLAVRPWHCVHLDTSPTSALVSTWHLDPQSR